MDREFHAVKHQYFSLLEYQYWTLIGLFDLMYKPQILNSAQIEEPNFMGILVEIMGVKGE